MKKKSHCRAHEANEWILLFITTRFKLIVQTHATHLSPPLFPFFSCLVLFLSTAARTKNRKYLFSRALALSTPPGFATMTSSYQQSVGRWTARKKQHQRRAGIQLLLLFPPFFATIFFKSLKHPTNGKNTKSRTRVLLAFKIIRNQLLFSRQMQILSTTRKTTLNRIYKNDYDD